MNAYRSELLVVKWIHMSQKSRKPRSWQGGTIRFRWKRCWLRPVDWRGWGGVGGWGIALITCLKEHISPGFLLCMAISTSRSSDWFSDWDTEWQGCLSSKKFPSFVWASLAVLLAWRQLEIKPSILAQWGRNTQIFWCFVFWFPWSSFFLTFLDKPNYLSVYMLISSNCRHFRLPCTWICRKYRIVGCKMTNLCKGC